MKKILFLLIILFVESFPDDPRRSFNEISKRNYDELRRLNFTKVVDTLYTFADYFVEVDLSKQVAYLYSRFDSVKTFKVSTGTKRIKDGIETNTGIFVIQHKAKKWYSTQFDSTLMLNWMGFNYGIGFHALLGNSYYKYLGNKTSSHGCIRISREDGKELFEKLSYGSPVLVHKGESAIKIGFADKQSFDYTYYDYENLSREIKRRLRHLYSGKFFDFVNEKLLIDQKNVAHQGLTIGEFRNVPARQKISPESMFIEIALPDLKCEFIPTEKFSATKLFANKE